MDKQSLLRYIAETAYNVGIGAKKSFATYDIVDKVPGVIGFLSMGVGVFALFTPWLSTQHMSATLIVFGILALYISFYNANKEKYADAGKKLTEVFNELKTLYFSVKDNSDKTTETNIEAVRVLERKVSDASIPKQILFSDWFAHYKFFWQHQIGWIDEQLNFKIFRDKVPLTLSMSILVLTIAVLSYAVLRYVRLCE